MSFWWGGGGVSWFRWHRLEGGPKREGARNWWLSGAPCRLTAALTEGTLSGFHDFFLQPIIKDRPKMHFFLMFQGSFNPPKDRFLGQKVCPVASEQTDTQTHTHTRKWIQRTPFQGFRNFSFNLSSRIDPITRIDTQHHYVNLVDYTAT